MGGTQHSRESCPEPSAEEKANFIQNRKGLWLFTKTWALPERTVAKGNVFLCHGYGEHVLRPGYQNLAKILNDAGFEVHGIEHQGHGRSNGERVHVQKFQDYVDDMVQFIEAKATETPERPNFLFGHSMGALISSMVGIHYSEKNPERLRAVILSAAPIMPDSSSDNAFNRAAGPLVSAFAPKTVPIVGGNKLDPKTLSRNTDAVQAYLDDKLIYKGGFRANQGFEMLLVGDKIRNNIKKFTLPVLLLHAPEDKIATIAGSHFFHDNCSSEDKAFVILENFFHEPFEDPESAKCTDEIVKFYTRIAESKPKEKAEVKPEPAAEAKPEVKEETSVAPAVAAEVKVEVKSEEPKAEETKAEEPKAEEPKAEEPKVEEVKAEEPKVEEPKEEPKVEETKAEEPKEEPKVEETKAEETKAEEPKVEEPKAEEPKAEEEPKEEEKVEEKGEEEVKAEEPKVEEEPKAEEPKVEEEPKAEEPKTEEPKAEEEPKVVEEEVKAEESKAEEPKAEEPKAEEPEAEERTEETPSVNDQ